MSHPFPAQVDRGARGCEVLLYLLALKVKHPSAVHLLRGNHESRACTGHFGFRSECRRKYGLSAYHEFCRVFEAMPLAATIDCAFGTVFACHGGIGPDLKTIADLDALERRAEPEDAGLLCDLLWADPARADGDDDDDGGGGGDWGPNPLRGCSVVFSEHATEAFLERNALTAIVRAHEVMENGLSCDFGDVDVPFETRGPPALVDAVADAGRTKLGKVTTVFSAANYCGTHHNLGAALLLDRTKASALLFEPCGRDDDRETKDEDEDEEEEEVRDDARVVRDAYLVVPYVPTSFRGLVGSAREFNGLAAPRVSPKPPAAGAENAPPPPANAASPPSVVSWADDVADNEHKRDKPPLPPPPPPPRSPGADASPARRFAAARRSDTINELAPAALRRRLAVSQASARTRCPAVKAFLAKSPFLDSRALQGKSTTIDSIRAGHTDAAELERLRDEMRASRRTPDARAKDAPRPAPASPARALRAWATSPARATPPPRDGGRAAPRTPLTPVDGAGFTDDEIFALRLIFSLFDADATGSISRRELAIYAEDVGEDISNKDIDMVFDVLDADGDKAVGLDEWVLFAAKLKARWELQAVPPTPTSASK